MKAGVLVVLVAGCVGRVGEAPSAMDRRRPPDPVGGAGGAGGTAGPLPPPASGAAGGRLRRLTSAELRNSVRDLMGDDVGQGELEPDSFRDGFASIGATYAAISARGLEQYDQAAQAAAHQVFADPARRAAVLGCAPAPDLAPCLRAFLGGFGRRAWRRPLTAEELDDYTAVGLEAARLLDAGQALEQLTVALLTSPHFLYRVELGSPDAAGRFRYGGWELASRLSYFLWNSTPDVALLDAAAAGALDTTAGLRAAAARLVQSPRARAGFSGGFGRDLLWLDALADTPKSDPRFTDPLRAAMEREALRLFEARLDPGSDLLDLFTTTRTFVDPELAALYGLPRPTGPAPADLPPDGPRAGLLGTAAFLSLYSAQDRTSPTARGVFVRERLLCQPMPMPPDNVDVVLPPGNLTIRQRLEQHRRNDGCRGCHELSDPVGYAFEAFDWFGAHRDRENGLPIDTSGSLDGFAFADARALSAHLRDLPEVSACLLRNLFRTANGHLETPADEPTLAAWGAAFQAAGRSLPAFLTELVASDGFRVVSPAP